MTETIEWEDRDGDLWQPFGDDTWWLGGELVLSLDELRERFGPLMPAVPVDFPVRVLDEEDPAEERMTCGVCGRSWDNAIGTSWTPVPSARCPFEYYHPEEGPAEDPADGGVLGGYCDRARTYRHEEEGMTDTGGGPRVVLWKREGRWSAAAYEGNGEKGDATVDLGIPDASPVTATETAARYFDVDPRYVAIMDPGYLGPRDSEPTQHDDGHFTVSWSIDAWADNPEQAATQAWERVRDPLSIANVFEVRDNAGHVTKVDLLGLVGGEDTGADS